MIETLTPWAALAGALALVPAARRRIELSLAKHPSLAGHARIARRIAAWMPEVRYDEERFFGADGAPAEAIARRRAGLDRLAAALNTRHAQTIEMTRRAREGLSDLQFTAAYRVPFQFSDYLRQRLTVGAFVERSDGVTLTDLDGRVLMDLTGSYGVNLLGNHFYKDCIAEGVRRANALGPVLGSYHPAVAFNVERLREISGLDEVSFHMSGTEAVMQAVRLARYHTRRRAIVRFTGAYHGWWEDVQPGPGNPMPPRDVYTLKEMDEASLRVLSRRRDIACVLVNPLQALHPNVAAPGDSALVDSSRRAGFDRPRYTQWLKALRQVCTERGIPLILDEVFLGFRLAPGGAQQYFGVRADLVTYGKTLGGGLPVGVLCGSAALMKRYRDERPADICFARGTFNAHPYVMATMQVFLERLQSPEVQALYEDLDATWDRRAAVLNARLESAGLPVRMANLQTVWTTLFTQPSRYNWMLQFYLREQGIALSWVGSGRLVFNLAWTEADFERFAARFVAAAHAMHEDGWWWHEAGQSNRRIRASVLRELIRHRF